VAGYSSRIAVAGFDQAGAVVMQIACRDEGVPAPAAPCPFGSRV
jgi:hypothetical protein